jgi:hypothetical protein
MRADVASGGNSDPWDGGAVPPPFVQAEPSRQGLPGKVGQILGAPPRPGRLCPPHDVWTKADEMAGDTYLLPGRGGCRTELYK